MQNKIIKIGKLFISGIIVALCINTASAFDVKTYNPAMCHPNNGVDQPKLRHWANGLKNYSGEFIWVTCPIVKDNRNDTTSNSSLSNSFVQIDQWNVSTTACIIRNDSYGQGSTSSATTFCSGPGSCQLNVPTNSYDSGTYTIQCRMAPWSRLHNIYYTETDGA